MTDGPVLCGDPVIDERMKLVYWSVRLRLTAVGVNRWFDGRRGWERNRRLLLEYKPIRERSHAG